MSIKILSITDNDKIIAFLFISLLLHMGILFIIPRVTLPKKVLPRLIPVDVIELPRPAEVKEKANQKGQIKQLRNFLPPLPVLPLKGKGREENASLPPQKVEMPVPVESKPSAGEKKQEPVTQGEMPGEKKEISRSTPEVKEGKPLTLFPSKERIAELSHEYEKQTPTTEEGKNLSFDTSEPRYISYLEGLKSKIYHEWEYPGAAVREGEAGRLFIRFIILKDGKLGDVTLVKSSGYPMLDEAALSAIRLAAPFYPFPKGFGSLERLTIDASFEYILTTLPDARRYRE